MSVSVSFLLFPCSKGQAVRAYLDTIQMTLLEIRIAKISKFVVKHCITPELGNPQVDVELVSISTFGVVSVAASISDFVVISNIVVGIVFV